LQPFSFLRMLAADYGLIGDHAHNLDHDSYLQLG
jgi:hypothetical protein